MALSGKQKQFLRGLAHTYKSVVTVGNAGLSDTVLTEIHAALDHHELIKIKLPAAPRAQRHELLAKICYQVSAENVQNIGRIGMIYRASDPPRIHLPS